MRVDTGAITQIQFSNSRSTRNKIGVFGDEIVGLRAPDKEVDSRLLYETARVSVQLEASDAAAIKIVLSL